MYRDPFTRAVAAEQRARDAQYYRRVLLELVDIGTDLARLVHQVQSQGTVDSQITTRALNRINRANRQNIILAHKLNAQAAPQAVSASQHRIAERSRIMREVENVIQRRTKTEAEADRRHDEFLDRLDDSELDDELDQRPVAEIVEDICRDLGIAGEPGRHSAKRRPPEPHVPGFNKDHANVVVPMRPRIIP